MYNDKFMKKAIGMAKRAAKSFEVPIGAVVVLNDEIVAVGRNMREKNNNGLHHAEIIALDRACKKLGSWRLLGCDIYITLEPCPMCLGALINTRISNVYFGAFDRKAGAAGSVVDINSFAFNHKLSISGGHMEAECAGLLSDFFSVLRKTKSK